MSEAEVVVRLKPSPIAVVDLCLEPEQVYNLLDALYQDEYNKPEDNLALIEYIEHRMVDADLPLDRRLYEEPSEEWKSVDAVFPIPVGH